MSKQIEVCDDKNSKDAGWASHDKEVRIPMNIQGK
jgi:hypothetical protein